jgi:hypothetical protein
MKEPVLTQHMDTCLDGDGWAANTFRVHADGVDTGIVLIERYERVPNSNAKKLVVRVLSYRGEELDMLDKSIPMAQRKAWVHERLPQPLRVDVESNVFLRDE